MTVDLPWRWNATDAEVAAAYPCDDHAPPDSRRLVRAVDVAAPPEIVFRWLCQLSVAPYSYDLIDNLGRRSPRTLTPGADRLTEGQPMLIFRLASFAVPEHLTLVPAPSAARAFGPFAMTYAVRPRPGGSRLLGVLAVGRRGPLGGLRRNALAWGDLVMMRKQLLTFRDLAEAAALGSAAD